MGSGRRDPGIAPYAAQRRLERSRRAFGCLAVGYSLHQRQRRAGLRQFRFRTPETEGRRKTRSGFFFWGIQNPVFFFDKTKKKMEGLARSPVPAKRKGTRRFEQQSQRHTYMRALHCRSECLPKDEEILIWMLFDRPTAGHASA